MSQFVNSALLLLLVFANEYSRAAADDTNPTKDREITNSIGIKLVQIPSGHTPENRPYYMGVYEVTQEEYQKATNSNPSNFSLNGPYRQVIQERNIDTSRMPVENVSWNDANEFCRKLSDLPDERKHNRFYRLPTEAEWELAARGGSKTAWSFGDRPHAEDISAQPISEALRAAAGLENATGMVIVDITPGSPAAEVFQKGDIVLSINSKPIRSPRDWQPELRANRGKPVQVAVVRAGQKATTVSLPNPETDDLDSYAWYAGNSQNRTHPVGQKKPNGFGLYDVSGNIAEWCLDPFDDPVLTGARLKIASANDPQTEALRRFLNAQSGFIVTQTEPGSEADRYFKTNDVLLFPEGENMLVFADLVAYYQIRLQQSKGRALPVEVFREGKRLTVEIPYSVLVPPNSMRAVRGGSYASLAAYTSLTDRGSSLPNDKAGSRGFRVVMVVR